MDISTPRLGLIARRPRERGAVNAKRTVLSTAYQAVGWGTASRQLRVVRSRDRAGRTVRQRARIRAWREGCAGSWGGERAEAQICWGRGGGGDGSGMR
ncbi:hypothetical protein SCP_0200180 [Sparassis crispa]|uniref:Uncharacterized protein n=1 Tax=Sparassis crispa TaxID=139825 RepID=A0A401G9I7_9APHY|nr:hypothetical protein SCP_0200180 [Sparassis crispa]GBE78821.1 hypothetical protein SCP_0200180 [Sparassis crispa]